MTGAFAAIMFARSSACLKEQIVVFARNLTHMSSNANTNPRDSKQREDRARVRCGGRPSIRAARSSSTIWNHTGSICRTKPRGR
jgi:hypothetical protein